MKKVHLQLTSNDRSALQERTSQGQGSVRVVKRAMMLLALDQGESLATVARLHAVTDDTVASLRNRYLQHGLACLQDAPRSGRPAEIGGLQRAQITALACSPAPDGHGQWSLRLLAEQVVELGYCATISHTQVGQILKKRRKAARGAHLVFG